jgi:hypothetical protein
MKVCVPITADGQVDPRWGRAGRVAVAEVADGEISDWQEFAVGWGALHDQGTEGDLNTQTGEISPDRGFSPLGWDTRRHSHPP